MHGFRLIWSMLAAGLLGFNLGAAEFRLTDGDVYKGEVASFNDFGLVIRREIGGYTPRIGWGQLTQETLQELKKNPEAAKYVDPFIDLPPEPKEKPKKKEIILKEVPRLERLEKTSFFASLANPAGLMLIAVFYLANLYGAFEVALYRQRSPLLVCGVSVVIPIVGPIVFLSLPGADAGMDATQEMAGGPAPETLITNPLATGKKTGPAPSSLGLAATDKKTKTEGAAFDGAVFKRGETTFNRRFFESKFSGFFPVIATGPEKDLVMVVRTGKSEYIAKRISRISMTDMHVQVLRGGTEAQISFGEIGEVLVRRRDAKA